MTVASSDATNLKNTTAVVHGEKIVLSGHKWVSLPLSIYFCPPTSFPIFSHTGEQRSRPLTY